MTVIPSEREGAQSGSPGERRSCVQSRHMLYRLSRHILYGFCFEAQSEIQRSTMVERWISRSSSRIRVLQ